MKKKIFFAALVLFIVFLNSMILIVSIIILRDKLSVVRDKCLAEHYVIASSLLGDMQALEQRGNHVEENIDSLMRLYSRYLQGKGNGLAVSFSGEWIYESPVFASQENMIFPPDTGYSQERLVYMQNGNRPVLCVYGRFPAPWQDYGLMYIGNLGGTVQSWRHTEKHSFFNRHCGNPSDVIFPVSVPEYYFSPIKTDFQCICKDCKWELQQQDSGLWKG